MTRRSIILMALSMIRDPYKHKLPHFATGDDSAVYDVINRANYILRQNFFAQEQVPEGSIVVLGDSLTKRCPWHFVLGKKVINRGIDGDTTAGIMHRISHVIALNPRRLFIQAGINDLLLGSSADMTARRYRDLIRKILKHLPANRIITLSLLPTSSCSLNLQIKALNASLMKYSMGKGIPFVDLYEGMEGNNGLIKNEFTHDGLHLTKEGYAAWCSRVKPLAK